VKFIKLADLEFSAKLLFNFIKK